MHRNKIPFWIVFSIVLAITFVGAFFMFGVDSSTSTYAKETRFDRIMQTQVLRVGYIEFPPFVIKDEKTGELNGGSVALIKEIARQANLSLDFVEVNWDTFVAGLQSNKFDVSIAPTYSTIARAVSIAFCRPQGYFGNSALIRAGDDRFPSLASIDRDKIVVAVTQGEQGHEYAMRNFDEAQILVQDSGSQDLTFMQVLSGRADVALGDAWAIKQFAAEHDAVMDAFPGSPYNIIGVSWAVEKSAHELLNFLNTSLDYLETTGFTENVFSQFNVPLYASAPDSSYGQAE